MRIRLRKSNSEVKIIKLRPPTHSLDHLQSLPASSYVK